MACFCQLAVLEEAADYEPLGQQHNQRNFAERMNARVDQEVGSASASARAVRCTVLTEHMALPVCGSEAPEVGEAPPLQEGARHPQPGGRVDQGEAKMERGWQGVISFGVTER
eukprot:407971-Rhodomonas_salina.2